MADKWDIGRDKMTPEDVTNAVRRIYDLRGDDEAAHIAEDQLHVEVLKAIANSTCEHPRECARITLTSEDIKFQRWCA